MLHGRALVHALACRAKRAVLALVVGPCSNHSSTRDTSSATPVCYTLMPPAVRRTGPFGWHLGTG